PPHSTWFAVSVNDPSPTDIPLLSLHDAPPISSTTITFTATPTGGVAPVSYKFLLTNNNFATYTVVQDWSTTATFAWTPTVADANYRIGVWPRSADVTTDTPQAAASIGIAITGV